MTGLPWALVFLIAAILLSSVAAAAFAGLWWGERGRRMDAQRREGVVPVGRPLRPHVTPPDQSTSTHDQEVALAEARERYIEETMAAGFTHAEAMEDWERMVGQVNVEQASPWQADG